MGLIATGSNGLTRDQILHFLKWKSSDELDLLSSKIVKVVFANGTPRGGPLLSIANGFWIDHNLSLKPAFKEIIDKTYRDASAHVDFQNQEMQQELLKCKCQLEEVEKKLRY